MNLKIFILLIGSFIILSSSSNSILGFAVGARKDKKKAPPVVIEGWDSRRVAYGTKMILLLDNGKSYKGRYERHSLDIIEQEDETKISFRLSSVESHPVVRIPVDQIQQVKVYRPKA